MNKRQRKRNRLGERPGRRGREGRDGLEQRTENEENQEGEGRRMRRRRSTRKKATFIIKVDIAKEKPNCITKKKNNA